MAQLKEVGLQGLAVFFSRSKDPKMKVLERSREETTLGQKKWAKET